MEHKKIETDTFNLNIIKTNKFKTINIRVCLRNKIEKDEITLRNLLTSFLTYSTATYPTKRDLVLKAQDLYAVNVYTKSYRSGKFNMINFTLSLLNEKYTEEGMLEESIKFLADILFNPNFNDKTTFNEAFNFLYDSVKKSMDSIKENPTTYSVIRMMEEMDSNMPYGYREYGYTEDLDNLNYDSLVKYYNKIITNSIVDVIVIGDVDYKEIEALVKKYFKFNILKHHKINQIIEHDKLPVKIKTVKESLDISQSKLSIGCKIDKLTEFERNYVLSIYSMILGGDSESKFFQIIREKNSLAYYVYSSLNKLDNLMLIKAGIAKENFDKTVSLIKKLMKDMENGEFTEEHLNMCKEKYISLLKEVEDNENAIIETVLAKEILNLGDIEERKREIMKVTIDDIINISKKIKIDTIFLLEGDGHNENN